MRRGTHRISKDGGTTCGFFCHQNEERDPRIRVAEAFVSKSIRAAASSEVTLDFLHGVLSRCKSPTASVRRELMHALLVTGRAQREDFPVASAGEPRVSSARLPGKRAEAEDLLA